MFFRFSHITYSSSSMMLRGFVCFSRYGTDSSVLFCRWRKLLLLFFSRNDSVFHVSGRPFGFCSVSAMVVASGLCFIGGRGGGALFFAWRHVSWGGFGFGSWFTTDDLFLLVATALVAEYVLNVDI